MVEPPGWIHELDRHGLALLGLPIMLAEPAMADESAACDRLAEYLLADGPEPERAELDAIERMLMRERHEDAMRAVRDAQREAQDGDPE